MKVNLKNEPMTDRACASDAKAQARPVKCRENIEQVDQYGNERKLNETYRIESDDRINMRYNNKIVKTEDRMTEQSDLRNDTRQIDPVKGSGEIYEKIKQLPEISLTPIRREQSENPPRGVMTSRLNNSESRADEGRTADQKDIQKRRELIKPISGNNQSRSDLTYEHARGNENIARLRNVRAVKLTRSRASSSDSKATIELDTTRESSVTSCTSAEIGRELVGRIASIAECVRRVITNMASSDCEVSSTDTDDIRRVEEKLTELQEMLNKAEKRRELKEQERRIDQMQRKLREKMSARKDKNSKRIDQIARQTQRCEMRSDEILRGQKRTNRMKHEEEMVDQSGKVIGHTTFEVDIEQETAKNHDITVKYLMSNGIVTRLIVMESVDRTSEPKSPPANESRGKGKRKNETTMRKQGKRSGKIKREPQPSTSRVTTTGFNDSVSSGELESPNPATIVDESEEESANISMTERSARKRTRIVESDGETNTKIKRNKKGRVIYDLKRSEIAKKNYINQMRAKDGTWSYKKESQLQAQVKVIIPRVQTDVLAARDPVSQPSDIENTTDPSEATRPRVISVEVIHPTVNDQDTPRQPVTVEQVAMILREIERKSEEKQKEQMVERKDEQAQAEPSVSQTPTEDTRIYFEDEGPLADISVQHEMEVETSVEEHERNETSQPEDEANQQDTLPERVKLLEEEVRRAVEVLEKDGQERLSEE